MRRSPLLFGSQSNIDCSCCSLPHSTIEKGHCHCEIFAYLRIAGHQAPPIPQNSDTVTSAAAPWHDLQRKFPCRLRHSRITPSVKPSSLNHDVAFAQIGTAHPVNVGLKCGGRCSVDGPLRRIGGGDLLGQLLPLVFRRDIASQELAAPLLMSREESQPFASLRGRGICWRQVGVVRNCLMREVNQPPIVSKSLAYVLASSSARESGFVKEGSPTLKMVGGRGAGSSISEEATAPPLGILTPPNRNIPAAMSVESSSPPNTRAPLCG